MELSYRIFILFVIFLVFVVASNATTRSGTFRTLHVAEKFNRKSAGHLPPQRRTLTVTAQQSDELSRSKRSVGDGSGSSTAPNITEFMFHDSHQQMMVHWAGGFSPVILTLARDIVPSAQSSSQLYISYNYGKTFKQLNLVITCPGKNRTNKAGVIEKFYHSDLHNSHYVFPDTTHDVLFLTKNFGETVTQSCLPFKPSQMAVHPENSDYILAMDETDSRRRLWGTTNFGVTWYPVQDDVKSFFWGVRPWDDKYDVYIERIDPLGNVIFKQNGLGILTLKQTILDYVVDFEVRDEYMFATRKLALLGSRDKNGTLQLWVSHMRKPFRKAQLPKEVRPKDFYIADVSEQQVFLVVNDNDAHNDLYISEVRGSSFVLSLRNIVYFNPKTNHRDSWLRWYAKESFADLHKVHGLRSVYIASRLLNASELSVENQVTLITYDKGGIWEPIPPPYRDADGHRFNCSRSPTPYYHFNPRQDNCSLHLSQLLSQWYPGVHTSPILSHESAPGIVNAEILRLQAVFSTQLDPQVEL